MRFLEVPSQRGWGPSVEETGQRGTGSAEQAGGASTDQLCAPTWSWDPHQLWMPLGAATGDMDKSQSPLSCVWPGGSL